MWLCLSKETESNDEDTVRHKKDQQRDSPGKEQWKGYVNGKHFSCGKSRPVKVTEAQ